MNQITIKKRPTEENKMTFFINAQHSDVSFKLRRVRDANLVDAQTVAIKVEDYLLSLGKWSHHPTKWERSTKSHYYH